MSRATSITTDSRLELLGPGWRKETAQDIQRMRKHGYKPPKEVLKALEHKQVIRENRITENNE